MRMNENNYVGKIKEIISICGNGMDLHIRLVLWQWDGPTYKTGVARQRFLCKGRGLF